MTELEELTNAVVDFSKQPSQVWLLGAGASCESNLPLVWDLTNLIEEKIQSDCIKSIKDDLNSEDAHIENVLTHLGDFIALAERSSSGNVTLPDGSEVSKGELRRLHRDVVKEMYNLITFGVNRDEKTGKVSPASRDDDIISYDNHIGFINTLLKGLQSGERRSDITFVTTNYDTLIEDSLNVLGYITNDGFLGGSVGVWSPDKCFNEGSITRGVNIIKLHGSADWVRHKDRIMRRRAHVSDFSDDEEILIYPQATKYKLTQNDPFQQLFSEFRKRLLFAAHNAGSIFICGYSWGDDHINYDIVSALLKEDSKLHVISFNKDMPPFIQGMRDKQELVDKVGDRVIVLHEKGVSTLKKDHEFGYDVEWWKFTGLINFLETASPPIVNASVSAESEDG